MGSDESNDLSLLYLQPILKGKDEGASQSQLSDTRNIRKNIKGREFQANASPQGYVCRGVEIADAVPLRT
jgi:hypothetical protein